MGIKLCWRLLTDIGCPVFCSLTVVQHQLPCTASTAMEAAAEPAPLASHLHDSLDAVVAGDQRIGLKDRAAVMNGTSPNSTEFTVQMPLQLVSPTSPQDCELTQVPILLPVVPHKTTYARKRKRVMTATTPDAVDESQGRVLQWTPSLAVPSPPTAWHSVRQTSPVKPCMLSSIRTYVAMKKQKSGHVPKLLVSEVTPTVCQKTPTVDEALTPAEKPERPCKRTHPRQATFADQGADHLASLRRMFEEVDQGNLAYDRPTRWITLDLPLPEALQDAELRRQFPHVADSHDAYVHAMQQQGIPLAQAPLAALGAVPGYMELLFHTELA